MPERICSIVSKTTLFFLLCLHFGVAAAQSESDPYAPAVEPQKDERNKTGWMDFERFDTFTGKLELSFKDIQISGRGDLPIELHRTYSWSDGEYKDPGFQAQRPVVLSGVSDFRTLSCYAYPYYATQGCESGNIHRQGSPGAEGGPRGESSDLWQWYWSWDTVRYKLSTGLVRPGGGWRFAVAPSIEVAAGPPLSQSTTWSGNPRFPINRFSDLNYMHAGICGATSTYAGRTVEFFVTLRFPDNQVQRMARISSGSDGVLRSANNWELRCVASGSPRLILMSPTGLKYDLGMEVPANENQESTRWLATKISNVRTGAWILIQYDQQNPRFTLPERLDASDGRWLKLTYDHRFDATPTSVPTSAFIRSDWGNVAASVEYAAEPALTNAEFAGGAWTYAYRSYTSLDSAIPHSRYPNQNARYLPPIKRPLLLAIQPDGRTWTFTPQTTAWNPDNASHRSSSVVGDRRLAQVTLPTGGTITYQMSYSPDTILASRGSERPSVSRPSYCSGTQIRQRPPFYYSGAAGYDQSCDEYFEELFLNYQAHTILTFTDRQLRLSTRTTSNGGLVNISYDRAASAGAYDKTTVSFPLEKITDTYFHVGESYFGTANSTAVTNRAWQVGNLIEHRRSWTTGSREESQHTGFEWTNRAFAPGEYWARGRSWLRDDASYTPLLRRKIVSVDGVTAATSYDSFTPYGSAQQIQEVGPDPSSGSVQMATKLHTKSYYTNAQRGLIDFIRDESATLSAGGSIPALRTPCQLFPASCQ